MPQTQDPRDDRASQCITGNVLTAMGLGLMPSTLIDIVGVTWIEVSMIRELARIYDFPTPHRLVAYKILLSLIGSVGLIYVSARLHSAVKLVPVIGPSLWAGLLSISGGAAVYAVGKVFQRHFQSGGTFLGTDPDEVRLYFKEKFEEGKRIVPGLAR